MYILDLILVYVIKYYFEEKIGTEQALLKKKAVKFTLWLIPVKCILLYLILGNYIPTTYKEDGKFNFNNLTKDEWVVHSQAVWGLTLFYPAWAPPLYILTKVRSGDESFSATHRMREPKKKCLKSSWSNIKACEKYLYRIGFSPSFQEEYLEGLDTYWKKNPERVCETVGGMVLGAKETIKKVTMKKYPYDPKSGGEETKWIYSENSKIYKKYLRSHLESSALNGCAKAARNNFDFIKIGEHSNFSWYGGEKSTKYLRFICKNYKETCNEVWLGSYKIMYRKNMPLANLLHDELCIDNKYRFCGYAREMTSKEYNVILKERSLKLQNSLNNKN